MAILIRNRLNLLKVVCYSFFLNSFQIGILQGSTEFSARLTYNVGPIAGGHIIPFDDVKLNEMELTAYLYVLMQDCIYF